VLYHQSHLHRAASALLTFIDLSVSRYHSAVLSSLSFTISLASASSSGSSISAPWLPVACYLYRIAPLRGVAFSSRIPLASSNIDADGNAHADSTHPNCNAGSSNAHSNPNPEAAY
jgi:hypothetical protein